MEELFNINWDKLLDTFREDKCVLFLGSGAYQAPGGMDLEEGLSQWLDANNPNHPLIRLYNSDGFFLLRKRRYQSRIITKIRKFYHQSFPETERRFKKVAEIPFSMIFTLTPDNILARTFDTYHFPYYSDFYFRHKKAPERFEVPSPEKPLIYNLLGNIDEPDSLVLTHRDFFSYLDSVFNGNSMNKDILQELENAECYIFLGLPYERWYFQLLLRVLSMHSDRLSEVDRFAFKEIENQELHELYTGEFNIQFIPTEISSFIDVLHNKCKDGGLLKTPENVFLDLINSEDISPEKIRNLLAKNKIGEAINSLRLFLDHFYRSSPEIKNDLIIIQGRFYSLKQRIIRGTINPRDSQVENRQIVDILLRMIPQM